MIETVEETILDEHAFARMLDYGLIAPRLTALYEFSATSLDQPQLTSLLDDGVPAYAWPHKDRPLWYIGNTGPHLRAIARASGVRLLREPSPLARSHRRPHRTAAVCGGLGALSGSGDRAPQCPPTRR
ncbi:hypothetical protein [Streptomyces sp. NPDC002205]|uniref:hypothetical protein n=1 Tax=Streptomyces sp. NPDC002205 TaxID=3154411 RepID=UPI0033317BA0